MPDILGHTPEPYTTTDEVEAAARAITKHKSLSWLNMPETWREEQYAQVRVIVDAMTAAATGGWTDPDGGFIAPAERRYGD